MMLTWQVSCLPTLGSRLASRSPTIPPTRFPSAVPPQNRAVSAAAGISEKPRVCSHIVKYPTAFHGIPPTTPYNSVVSFKSRAGACSYDRDSTEDYAEQVHRLSSPICELPLMRVIGSYKHAYPEPPAALVCTK